MKIIKEVTIIMLLLCNTILVLAQNTEKSDIYYLGANGSKATTLNSSKYTRTVTKKGNIYEVIDYYFDKSIKSKGNSTVNGSRPKYDGEVISYYKNGSKEAVENYSDGKLESGLYYFPNQKLEKAISYNLENEERVEQLNDSLGNQFLDKKGTGSFKSVEKDGVILEGSYLKGLKNGIWKTSYKTDVTYSDEYKSGKYIRGKTLNKDGEVITYNELSVLPQYKGGITDFSTFLKENMRHPSEAKSKGISGRVYLSFVVEKDGSLTNVKVTRGIGSGCDEEALRLINSSPKWKPGYKRGIAVRSNYTLPVSFNI